MYLPKKFIVLLTSSDERFCNVWPFVRHGFNYLCCLVNIMLLRCNTFCHKQDVYYGQIYTHVEYKKFFNFSILKIVIIKVILIIIFNEGRWKNLLNKYLEGCTLQEQIHFQGLWVLVLYTTHKKNISLSSSRTLAWNCLAHFTLG